MTEKTKKQLRAEAVERLKNTAHWLMCFYSDGGAVYWHADYQPERESVGQAMLKDIELLTYDDTTTESLSDEADSREKLEADVRNNVAVRITPNRNKDGVLAPIDEVFGWLDRQAAITEREWLEGKTHIFGMTFDKVRGLQAKVEELTAERDKYRQKFGKALDLAHEIARLGD